MALSLDSNKNLNVADYEKWTQDDWQEFVKSDGKKADGNVVLLEPFQRRLMEVGVFGHSEFFQKVLAPFRAEMEGYEHTNGALPYMPYLVTRIFLNSWNVPTRIRERLVFELEDQTILLQLDANKTDKFVYWQILEPYVIQHGEQALIDFPNIYLQITQIASIEKIAKETLQMLLPPPIGNIILQYMGRFPSHALQNSAERMKDIRQMLFGSFKPRVRSNNAYVDLDPQRRHGVALIESVSSIVTQYVGETDVAEEASEPAKT